MFFDEYDRFLNTGTVFTAPHRLNLRHKAIIDRNRDVLKGAKVLDIASHDGRWSFAALDAGAAHVTGIEARGEGVEKAKTTFADYGVDPSTYSFVQGDIFEELRGADLDVDVVMCLGFLYHTYRHTELLKGIRELNPRHVLVDTTVIANPEPVMRLRRDSPENDGQAVLDPFAHRTHTLVARPSAAAVRMMLKAYDFDVESEVDWPALIDEHHNPEIKPREARVGDYRKGTRVTMRASSTI